ncbi:hypothetical protein LY78DRAFT_741333 [Colletotrichum sublineola]|nr:hypothetical protein LY78DRAFT_741333 [Colletotrichum sublineola]
MFRWPGFGRRELTYLAICILVSKSHDAGAAMSRNARPWGLGGKRALLSYKEAHYLATATTTSELRPPFALVVPYQVAQFWDTGLRQRIEDKTTRLQAQRKRQQRKDGSATGLGVGEVPRDLRDTAKRTPAVRGWVRVLEEPVRAFLAERTEASDAEGDSEDDEIVFVGRRQGTAATNGGGSSAGWKKARREVGSEQVDTGMVFDALGADDESASFKRWLTHSISDYYGLQSHSVTTGEPARKVVYITVRDSGARAGPKKRTGLPRPLWEMC